MLAHSVHCHWSDVENIPIACPSIGQMLRIFPSLPRLEEGSGEALKSESPLGQKILGSDQVFLDNLQGSNNKNNPKNSKLKNFNILNPKP
jgi:hypothetical protein